MNKSELNLLEGSIPKGLTKLAIPIMATSFLQMAYNMIDIMWIGKLGSLAVAAVGTAGFFMWLAFAGIIIPKIGAEVLVAKAIGRRNYVAGQKSASAAIQVSLIFGIIYGLVVFIFNKQLISFFRFESLEVIFMARQYLKVITIGFGFAFINPIFTAIYNGYGLSKLPFKINGFGLVVNIILDPLFIFYFDLGVLGAAYATILSQFLVTLIYLYHFKIKKHLFKEFSFFQKNDLIIYKEIFDLGFPAGLRSGLFTIIAMIIARLIAQWGAVAIAVQKIGSQIEALSWMTSEGFATATSTYMAQNYSAGKYNRMKQVYKTAIKIMALVGIFVTLIFLLFPKFIFSIFLTETEALKEGIIYLRILGVSQLFMCVEITTGGAFNGLSKTIYPSVISISFNLLRIPMAIALSQIAYLGLKGIWISISISSIFKGVISVIVFKKIFTQICQAGYKKA